MYFEDIDVDNLTVSEILQLLQIKLTKKPSIKINKINYCDNIFFNRPFTKEEFIENEMKKEMMFEAIKTSSDCKIHYFK